MLYIAIGILGATVMPHNLYLHSSIVQTRKYEQHAAGKAETVKFATLDSTGALIVAFFSNAAILVVSAATFHVRGQNSVAEIEQACQLLSPTLGVPVASVLFALALLAIIPAIICIGVAGDRAVGRLIVFSQVILSMQLAFAVVPLVRFAGSRRIMGQFADAAWLQALAWVTTGIIISLNAKLLLDTCGVTTWLMNRMH